MRQYVYLSTASEAAEGQFDRILASSVRNNATRQITGFLLFNGRNFLQLIEGPDAALQALLATLARDGRHAGLAILFSQSIVERCSPDWWMRGISLLDPVADRRSKVESLVPQSLVSPTRELVLNFASLN